MQLTTRHKIYVAGGIAGLILILAIVFVFLPQFGKLSTLREEHAQREAEVKTARVTVERLEDAQSELDDVREKIAQFSTKIPPSENFPGLLREVQKLTNESGVRFVSFRTEPLVGQAEYAELPVQISVDGYFRDLVDFLWRINTLNREMKVNSIDIGEGENKLPHIKVDIAATAFVLKKLPKQQQQEGAGQSGSETPPPS